LLLLWKLVSLDWEPEVAGRTVWVYLLFPSTFFLSGAYSESALLAASTGALLAARRARWLTAGTLTALATLARPIGGAVLIAVLPELAEVRQSNPTASVWRPLGRVLVPVTVAVAAFFLFSTSTFGDPLAALESQSWIRGPIAPPWQPFV